MRNGKLIKYNILNAQVNLIKDKFNCLIDIRVFKNGNIQIQYELLSKFPDLEGINYYLKKFGEEYTENSLYGITWSKANRICREDIWDYLDNLKKELMSTTDYNS